MKPTDMNRRVLLSALALLPAFQPRTAMAQQAAPAASSAFSFVAYGDSRPMMYLPLKDGQPDVDQAVRRNVRPGHAGEGRGRGGEERM